MPHFALDRSYEKKNGLLKEQAVLHKHIFGMWTT